MAGKRSREHRIRKSQLITPFGVGAIMEFPTESLMHAGLDAWTVGDDQNLADDRLAQRLGVKNFYEPVQAPEPRQSGGDNVPFVRFPLWHVCPRCRTLQQASWNDRQPPRCTSNVQPRFKGAPCGELPEKRRPHMVPVRFIIACSDGHIDDFPWIEWAHTPRGKKLTPGTGCEVPILRLDYTGRAGLMGLSVRCESCGSKRSLAGAGSPDALKDFGCTGNRPWLGPDAGEECRCEDHPRVVQRGATNVYFSRVVSSILIPPYSTFVRRFISRKKNWELLTSGVDENGRPDMARLSFFAEEHGIPIGDLTEAVNERLGGISRVFTEQTEEDFRFDEYKAFRAGANRNRDDDLNVIPQVLDDYDADVRLYFQDIVLVEKLTETRTLTGFSRMNPPDMHGEGGGRVAPLSKRKLNWLPAMRAYGEGIFFTLNQDLLDKWSGQTAVQKRFSALQNRLSDVRASRGQEPRIISPAFVLLHTLAHILIRRLSFDCGYGSSSLRERIYCRQSGGEHMAGILIYTAASDSEGTLGGLVRQGKPGRFEQTLRYALVDATNCSSDPLCSESVGQGSDALNLAACHACCLIPETSCEEGNRLLDRLASIGSIMHPEAGFFGSCASNLIGVRK